MLDKHEWWGSYRNWWVHFEATLTDHHADACKSRESNTYWCELRNSQRIRFVSSNTVFELGSSTHPGGQRGRGDDGEAKSACARHLFAIKHGTHQIVRTVSNCTTITYDMCDVQGNHLRWERAEAAARRNASRLRKSNWTHVKDVRAYTSYWTRRLSKHGFDRIHRQRTPFDRSSGDLNERETDRRLPVLGAFKH